MDIYLTNNLTLIKEISGNDDLLLESYQTLQSIRTNKSKLANGIELLVNSPQFGEAFKNRFEESKSRFERFALPFIFTQ